MAVLDPRAGRHRRLRNVAEELLLLTAMVAIFGAVGWLLLGLVGLLSVLLAGLTLAVLRPRVPVGWVLWMYRAEPLPRWAAPQLHWIVDVLTERAGLHRRPALYYVASPVANAFVAGRQGQAALAVTDGLLRLLNGRELAGVLAHEISHLRNGDTAVMGLSDLIASVAQWMAWVGCWSFLLTVPLAVSRGAAHTVLLSVLLLVVPSVVSLLQLVVSRSREYDADVDAAHLTGDPEGLARALIALDVSEGRIWERIMVGRSRAPDPLLLQTHPRTEQRVHRLRALPTHEHRQPPSAPHPTAPVGYPLVTHRPRLRGTGVRW